MKYPKKPGTGIEGASKINMQYLGKRMERIAAQISSRVLKERTTAYEAERKVEEPKVLAKFIGRVKKMPPDILAGMLLQRESGRYGREDTIVFKPFKQAAKNFETTIQNLHDRLRKKHKLNGEQIDRYRRGYEYSVILPEVQKECDKVADAIAFSDSPDVAKMLADLQAKKF